MIGSMMMGSRDIAKAAPFYDAIAEIVGAQRVMDFGHAVFWGAPGTSLLGITASPYNGETASVGNGVMAGVYCASAEMVQAVHARALSLGGEDEGGPGERGPGFYAAYFRDLDGNKIAAIHKS